MIQTYPDFILPSGSGLYQSYPKKLQSSASYKILYVSTRDIPLVASYLKSNDHNCRVFKSFYDAACYLRHLADNSGQLPDAIISYYERSGMKDAGELGGFLAGDERLSAIPFILIHEKQSSGEAMNMQMGIGIDDIVRSSITLRELYNKISVLKKFKSLKQSGLNMTLRGKNNISPGREILHHIDRILKRTLDILVVCIMLIPLLPLMLLIAIIIKLESKGPVFYTACRAGSNYRIFKFIKFRSMVADADQKLSALKDLNQYGNTGKDNAVFFKVSNDPRITRFGKILRNTSLDELPQIFNILKGDMSLVGNRPLPLYEAKALTTDLHVERFNAPAGLTGLWQVSKRGKKEMSVGERVSLDIHYARKHSIWYDLRIILLTPMALIQKDNV